MLTSGGDCWRRRQTGQGANEVVVGGPVVVAVVVLRTGVGDDEDASAGGPGLVRHGSRGQRQAWTTLDTTTDENERRNVEAR